jgi:CrcB protein
MGAMIGTFLQVALGGALGSMARYGTGLVVARLGGGGWPVATLAVNVVGSLVMGIAFVWLAERGLMRAVPFLMAGLLGGFTTFSAFSLDAWLLWERGSAAGALAYVAASVLLSLAALALGIGLARWVLA